MKKMSLSREVRNQRKSKPVKCSRHYNQNGLISANDRIYANNTVSAECNNSKCKANIFAFFLCASFDIDKFNQFFQVGFRVAWCSTFYRGRVFLCHS